MTNDSLEKNQDKKALNYKCVLYNTVTLGVWKNPEFTHTGGVQKVGTHSNKKMQQHMPDAKEVQRNLLTIMPIGSVQKYRRDTQTQFLHGLTSKLHHYFAWGELSSIA